MIINIKVKPNSGKQEIKKITDNEFVVNVKSSASEGKANMELLKLLTKFFKKKIKIKSGLNSRKKIIEIGEQLQSEAIKRSCPSEFRGKSARKTRGVLA